MALICRSVSATPVWKASTLWRPVIAGRKLTCDSGSNRTLILVGRAAHILPCEGVFFGFNVVWMQYAALLSVLQPLNGSEPDRLKYPNGTIPPC